MAARLLTDETCVLGNVPRIADVEVMARLLLDLGAEVEGIGSYDAAHSLPRGAQRTSPTARSSAACAGRCCCWARCSRERGRAYVAPPGGDFPARRTIGRTSRRWWRWAREHIEGPGHRLETPHGLKPASIYLDEASVTGTETAILAAAAAPGISEIRHAACEPHVVELCEFLRAMGVGITGEGSHTIRVEGAHGAARREQDALWGLHRSRELGRGRRDHGRAKSKCVGARPVDMEVVDLDTPQAARAVSCSDGECSSSNRRR